jgi:hypothetical protein
VKIAYAAKKLGQKKLALVEYANRILNEYVAQGFDLTLRQLFYQFVSRDLIPNAQRAYKTLGDAVSDGRMNGLIDWDHIVDRTRNVRSLSHWKDPADIIAATARSFHTDLWATQDHRLEVWIEKDALVGVIQGVCSELDVPYFSCRGYVSKSEMWSASQRLLTHLLNGQDVRILHLGDHDPRGIDMSRDIEEQLRLFIMQDYARERCDDITDRTAVREAMVEVSRRFALDRLALNYDQIQRYNPPPNPAKVTDSRFDGYMREHGSQSWELDALEPAVLANLIRDSAESYMDEDRWDEAMEQERRYTRLLEQASSRWSEIEGILES